MLLTDLSVVRPIRSQKPVCRPGAATIRHVREIEDKKSMTVCVVADQSHAGSTGTTVGKLIGCVRDNLHPTLFLIRCHVVVGYRYGLVDISVVL